MTPQEEQAAIQAYVRLAPRDQVIPAPGQENRLDVIERMHPNALNIYALERRQPEGDLVLPSPGAQERPLPQAMPWVPAHPDLRGNKPARNDYYRPGFRGISAMTPQEEQQAMQEYVRQQLLARQRLNLTPGQQPIASGDQAQFLQRPPIAPGVGQASPPEQLELPVEVTGELAPRRLREMRGVLDQKFMYRKNVPF